MSILVVIFWGFILSGEEGREGQRAVFPPTTYELMINGESFFVEAGRLVRLHSKLQPGTTYEVALRISPVQYLRLNQIRLTYDLGTKIEDNRQPERRGVRMGHPQGCLMLITELGEPLDPADRDTALRMLTESVVETYRGRQIPEANIEIARLENTTVPAGELRGVQIRYQDAKQIEHRTLIYLVVGKTFTCSCIFEYLQVDEEKALPIIKRTLDSIEPISSSRTGANPGRLPKGDGESGSDRGS